MNSPKVFISYSHQDENWAREFAESLKNLGMAVWFDDWNVRPGDPLSDMVERGLRESDLVVLLLNPESANRPNVLFELGAAVGLGKRIVPIVPEDADLSQFPGPIKSR